MIRAVVDTNILASGAIASQGTISTLTDAWALGRFRLFISLPILMELERTLRNPYFAKHLDPAHISDYMELLRSMAILTPLSIEVRGVATHPEDDLILATALSAPADYLVTGDRKLQVLGTYQGVAILSPRAFLDLLSETP